MWSTQCSESIGLHIKEVWVRMDTDLSLLDMWISRLTTISNGKRALEIGGLTMEIVSKIEDPYHH